MKHADHDAAASRILASWLDQRDRGTAPPIDELIRAHPNCADELRAGLAGLRTLERPAAGEDESNRLPVPEQIGDYRIVREVGRGGMGVVFEAEQVSMGRRVALKLLTPTLTGAQRAVKRFQREAKAAGRLHHTNIVPVYALGQEAGFWYYAMELVVGLSLSEMLGQMRRLDDESRTEHGLDVLSSSAGTRSDSGSRTGDTWFRRVAEVFAGVADALQVAHDEGVIHRDIKPSNLLLDADGVLKIVDFGLAHLEDPGPSMTLTGDLVGTPAYMSPEQALAKRITLDHRTDIYSLGATLYEVLTLQPPFVGRSLQELCAQIVTKDPALPRRVDVRIPRDLETIVLKAMEKDRDKRYQRAADFAEDLRLFALGSVIAARRAGPIERTWRKIKRHKGVASLAAGLILVSAVGASLAWRVNTEASQRRELEYLQLVARAETELGEVVMTEANQSFVAELRPRDAHERPPGTSSPGIELLAEAIDLMPQRPEAYVLRALASDRSKDERLSDIERAEANGVATTSAALMRRMLGDATGNTPELEVEDVQPKTPLEAYLKASILLRDGGPRTREAAIELLGRAIDSSSLESFVRRLSLERRARVRINDNDLQGAISDLEALRGLGDARLEVQLIIADLWIRLGRQQRGDELFDEVVSAVAARDEIAEWRELLRVLAHVIQRLDWVESAGDELRATRPESVEAALMVAKDLHDVSRHLPMGSGSGAGPWPRVRAQEAARAVYEVAARLDPESVEVLDAYASLLRGMEAWRDVLAVYERRLRLTPDHLPTLRRMEDALRSSGDLEGALAAAERTLEIAPDDPRSHVDVARALTLLGRSDEAIAAAERGIACATAGDAPGLVGVCYQWKGEALLREDRHEEALLAFDEARRLIVHVDGLLASFSHRMRLFRATALEHLGRLADAIEEIRTVTDAEPADYRAHTELCRVLTKAGEWDALQAERQRLVDRFPQEPTTWNNLAWFWVGDETPDEHHDAEQGLEAAERAVLLSHKPDPAFLDTLAHAQFLSGELAAAIASQRQAIDAALAGGDERRAEYEAHLERFEAALAATPAGSTPSTSTARALHHLRANELDEAEALARSALAAEPDQPDALGIVAEVALARGRAEVAVAPARRAVELDPRSERLHRVLVHALRASGAPAERDEEIARWIRLAITERDPARRVLALQRYGQRATGRWDRETAVVAFGLACEVQTDNPAAWFWFAVSQRHAGRYRAALAAYRRGIELAARVAKPWAGIPGTPSEQWLRRVELLAAREPHLAALVGGRAEPEDADECIAAAWLAYERQQFATAVALRRRSMEFEPELATDPRRDARYQMACAATLGGFGLGFDAETESQRQALRATAHSTLSELLVQWREWSASDDPERAAFARARLRHWIRDKDVNKSRDATRLANLTEEERAAWQALWSEVDGLLE